MFEVWITTYENNDFTTELEGTYSGSTFNEACQNYLTENGADMSLYDSELNSYPDVIFYDIDRDWETE